MLTSILVALAHAWTLGAGHVLGFVVGSTLVGAGLVAPLVERVRYGSRFAAARRSASHRLQPRIVGQRRPEPLACSLPGFLTGEGRTRKGHAARLALPACSRS